MWLLKFFKPRVILAELGVVALITLMTAILSTAILVWIIAAPIGGEWLFPAVANQTVEMLKRWWEGAILPYIGTRLLLPYGNLGLSIFNQIKTHINGVHWIVHAASFLFACLLVSIFRIGKRSLLNRMSLAVVRVVAGLGFGYVLLVINLLDPDRYAWLATFSHATWQSFIDLIRHFAGESGRGPLQSVVNALEGTKGHHIMLSIVGALVGMVLAFAWDFIWWCLRFTRYIIVWSFRKIFGVRNPIMKPGQRAPTPPDLR